MSSIRPLQSSPWLTSAWLSQYSTILRRGVNQNLKPSDLPPLPPSLLSPACTKEFYQQYASYLNLHSHSLIHFLQCTIFTLDFLILVNLKLINCVLSFGTPYFLQQLIDYSVASSHTHNFYGIHVVLAFIVFMFISAFLGVYTDIRTIMYKARLKSGLSNILVINASRIRLYDCRKYNTAAADVTNMLQIDVDRVCEIASSANEIWSLPLFICISIVLLYLHVKEAFLVGVIIIIIFIPFNTYISNCIGKATECLMTSKDYRLSFLTEIIKNITSIKIQNQESVVIKELQRRRYEEFRYLSKRKYYDVIYVIMWAVLPITVPLATFIVANYRNIKLSISDVFLSITLLKMLIFPLNSIPFIINSIIDSSVSLQRVSSILRAPECEDKSAYQIKQEDNLLSLNDAEFCHYSPNSVSPSGQEGNRLLSDFDAAQERFIVGPISLQASAGQLIGIVGAVGSGKSSLLLACLGEMHLLAGSSSTQHLCSSFCSQQPIFIASTLRENIILDQEIDEERYAMIIEGTQLDRDIEGWPLKDSINIDCNGSVLSGGQKARVNLARALYAHSSRIILDDVFSSLDTSTAASIMKFIIFIARTENRLIVLATHSTYLLKDADRVYVLEGGCVVSSGSHTSMISSSHPQHISSPKNIDTTVSEFENESINRKDKSSKPLDSSFKWDIVLYYLTSIGPWLVIGTLLSIFLMQSSIVSFDLWMAHWSVNSSSIPDRTFARVSFLICSLLFTATIARAILFAEGCLKAAKSIFSHLAIEVIQAPLSAFENISFGDFINLFGRDTFTVDDELPFALNSYLAQVFYFLGSVFILFGTFPVVIAPLLIVLIGFVNLYQTYRVSSRNLRYILTDNRSTVYANVSEFLSNGPQIRAQNSAKFFVERFRLALDIDLMLNINSSMISFWLTIRTRILGSMFIGCIALCLVISRRFYSKSVSPETFALCLTSSIGIVNQLGGLIVSLIVLEVQFISVERVSRIHEAIVKQVGINLSVDPSNTDDAYIPKDGGICVQDISMAYGDVEVVRGASFSIPLGSRVAIIGRTGSGKSTFVKMLVQIVKYDGSVKIGGVELSHIDKSVLNKLIYVVPQDPLVLSGSLRFNLDPHRNYSDIELERCVEISGLTLVSENRSFETSNHSLLDFPIQESGSNLSQGQKQLIHIIKALLLKVQILVLDEVTSFLDGGAECNLYDAVVEHAKESTILVVCHKTEKSFSFCTSTLIFQDRCIVHKI